MIPASSIRMASAGGCSFPTLAMTSSCMTTVPFDMTSLGVSIVPRRDHDPATAYAGLRNSAAARMSLAKPKSLAISVLSSRGISGRAPRRRIYHGLVDHGTEEPRSLARRSLSGITLLARAAHPDGGAGDQRQNRPLSKCCRPTCAPTDGSADKVNRISQGLRTRTQEVRPRMFPSFRSVPYNPP
jgi:hypothetical protein